MDVFHKVLITRPLEFTKGLCQGIVALGIMPEWFPTIHIIPTAHKETLIEIIKTLKPWDRLIFVSRTSVHFTVPIILSIFKEVPPLMWCAVGPGTAAALEAFDISPIVAPYVPPYESESLLALPEFTQSAIEGQRIFIFRGNGGRALLPMVLNQRGAFVQCVETYERCLPIIDMDAQWAMWQKTPIDIIVSTSLEGMNNLLSLVKRISISTTAVEWLKTIPIIVISTRMEEAARHLGFEKIMLAFSAEDAAIIQAVKEIRENCNGGKGNI